MRDQQMRMVFILVVGAVILAVTSFLAIMMVSRRSDPAVIDIPQEPVGVLGTSQVIVDNYLITLYTDPAQAVYLRDPLPTASEVIPPDQPPVEPPPAQLEFPTPTPEPLPPVQPALPPQGVSPVIFIDYVVQSGDTLYGIAERHNSAIELMALHEIASDSLVVGRTLRLPIANPAFCPGRRAYVVRDKDTVFRIAQQFGTTAPVLQEINGLGADYRINVTQVICVP